MVSDWKVGWESPKGSPKRILGWEAYDNFRKAMKKCFHDYPAISYEWFPKQPWQALNKEIRQTHSDEVKEGLHHYWNNLPHGKLSIHTLRELEGANVKAIGSFQWTHECLHQEEISETEYGFFAINWNHDNSDIKDAFGKWLTEQRNERQQRGLTGIKHIKKSRGGFKDRLNWLGALRVVEFYPAAMLTDYPDSNLKIDAPYSHAPDLYENAKKAREYLRNLISLLP